MQLHSLESVLQSVVSRVRESTVKQKATLCRRSIIDSRYVLLFLLLALWALKFTVPPQLCTGLEPGKPSTWLYVSLNPDHTSKSGLNSDAFDLINAPASCSSHSAARAEAATWRWEGEEIGLVSVCSFGSVSGALIIIFSFVPPLFQSTSPFPLAFYSPLLSLFMPAELVNSRVCLVPPHVTKKKDTDLQFWVTANE